MVMLPAKSRLRGQKAEAVFKSWLDRSKLGYMIVDQTPFSVPISADAIKRPDFLVGIMDHTLAIDVKGRDFFDGCGIIEISEREGFDYFRVYFGTPVWYVWYPTTKHEVCYIFRNTDIRPSYERYLNGRPVFAIPVEVMTKCHPYDQTFDYAMFLAGRTSG